MALSLICACGARFEVEDTLAGQDVACPECQQSLKAPALRQPSLRTSDLALSSTVLALVGAFTLIGTVVAVVLGCIALIRIHRNRDSVAGTGFAIFGITAGTVFTVLTFLAFSSNELFGLGGTLRHNMLADRVDTTGELTFEDADDGFSITRPSRQWGISSVERLEDPFVNLLQGPNARKINLLLVQTHRSIYVDVQFEPRLIANADIALNEAVAELTPAPVIEQPPFGVRGRNRDEGGNNLFKIVRVVPAASSKRLQAGEGVEAREEEVSVQCTGQKWKMLVRVYLLGDRLYVVRAYGQHRHFDNSVQEVRKLLDSFTIR